MSCWKRMEKIKWPEKVTNEQVLEHIGEKRTLLNNILRRKTNLIYHVLRRNYLLHDLRNRRRYWEPKGEAEDRKNVNDSLSVEHKQEICYLP
jgi:hypothetical protein